MSRNTTVEVIEYKEFKKCRRLARIFERQIKEGKRTGVFEVRYDLPKPIKSGLKGIANKYPIVKAICGYSFYELNSFPIKEKKIDLCMGR